MKVIKLKFFGYTWEDYAFQISSLKGVFVIYKGSLNCEGSVILQKILYVGYHKGIYELYDMGCMTKIKESMGNNDRIFLSYAEVPFEADGKEIESFLRVILNPEWHENDVILSTNLNCICEGSCALFPNKLLYKEL